MKIIIFAFLLACLSSFGTAFGQLATIPTVQGNNSFSGTNSYTGNSNLKLINTIPQADQFTGADMCLKLQAAISAAYSGGISLVDATHFTGTQTCSVNPLATLSRPLTILLGAVHVQAQVPWTINTNQITLKGFSPFATQIEYVGSTAAAILTVASSTPSTVNLNGVSVSNVFLYGDVANVTDGLLIEATHRSEFANIDTWGLSGCGIHSEFAVTDTFYRPATSFADATLLGIYNGSHTTPVHGLCFDAVNGGQTTSGTVIDGKAEGVAGTGWWLASATSMTFESGTSENNSGSGPGGIQVDHLSKYNTFTSTDLEGNSNEDALDNGSGTKFVNVIAGSSGGIQVGPSATFSQVDSPGTTPSYASGSEFSWGLQGSEIISKHVANAAWSGASVGFNALGDNEADWYTDSQATSCAHAWFGWNGSSSASLGCLTPGGQMNTPHGYEVGGTAGFSGAVAISGCTLTYSGGILTGKSGKC